MFDFFHLLTKYPKCFHNFFYVKMKKSKQPVFLGNQSKSKWRIQSSNFPCKEKSKVVRSARSTFPAVKRLKSRPGLPFAQLSHQLPALSNPESGRSPTICSSFQTVGGRNTEKIKFFRVSNFLDGRRHLRKKISRKKSFLVTKSGKLKWHHRNVNKLGFVEVGGRWGTSPVNKIICNICKNNMEGPIFQANP